MFAQLWAETSTRAKQKILKGLLDEIEAEDLNYAYRYGLVLQAVTFAHLLGMPAGFRIDLAEPEWPVAYIELPPGQVSWHLPQHPTAWDGHDTPAKYRRCRDWEPKGVF